MQEPNYGIKNDNAIIMIHTINSKDIEALVLPVALHGKIWVFRCLLEGQEMGEMPGSSRILPKFVMPAKARTSIQEHRSNHGV